MFKFATSISLSKNVFSNGEFNRPKMEKINSQLIDYLKSLDCEVVIEYYLDTQKVKNVRILHKCRENLTEISRKFITSFEKDVVFDQFLLISKN